MTMDTRRPTSPLAEQILGLYFPVLDHGFVSLVDYMGTDVDVERAARVSYGATGEAREIGKTRTLLRYLKRHAHTTPFEMVELKFHCCMPIFVARQWIRHRTASVNEMSGRYSMLPMLFYTPERSEFRVQSKTNKQGGQGTTAVEDKVVDMVYQGALERWREGRARQSTGYEWLTGHDIARELARIDLPLSTYTQWYWKIDLHNLMHFLRLRVDGHAQWEIQQYGRVMAGMLKRVAPLAYEAWIDYDVAGVRFSRMEMNVLRRLVRGNRLDGRVFSVGRSDISEEGLREEGLSAREIGELTAKLESFSSPDFDLDLASAKSGEYFEAQMREATPTVDMPSDEK